MEGEDEEGSSGDDDDDEEEEEARAVFQLGRGLLCRASTRDAAAPAHGGGLVPSWVERGESREGELTF